MKFYLKERNYSQLAKPFYVAMGQISKKDAKKNERTVHGRNRMIGFDNEDEYKAAIEDKKAKGYNVIDIM